MSAILALLLLAQPDSRGEEVTPAPAYQGTKANAPVPAALHIRNEGGSDGAGLCVISSVLVAGQYQGVPGLAGQGKGSQLWKTAKTRPGGYYPDKLTKILEETVPGETYVSYSGTDPSILETLSKKGMALCATMNTGALYGYKRIHHMINVIHYQKDKWACVVDNNDPGKYHWMPASEYLRRWVDGGSGWVFAWTRLPKLVQAFAWLAWAPLVIVLAIVAARSKQMRLGVVLIALGLCVAPAQAQGISRSWIWAQVDGSTQRVWGWMEGGQVHYEPGQNKHLERKLPKTLPPAPEPTPVGPIAPAEQLMAAGAPEAEAENFGLDLTMMHQVPSGSIITNDPAFTPDAAGISPMGQAVEMPAESDAAKAFLGPVLLFGVGALLVARATRK